MAELIVIFRTASSIEASVVQALLDSHGIQSVRTSGPPQASRNRIPPGRRLR